MQKNERQFFNVQLDSFKALAKQAAAIKSEVVDHFNLVYQNTDHMVKPDSENRLFRGCKARLIRVSDVFVDGDVIFIAMPYKDDGVLSIRAGLLSINDIAHKA